MRWLRLQRRYPAWAALLALLVQLTISFGHRHSFDSDAAPAPHTGSTSSTPADDDRLPLGDVCAICIAAAQLASAQLPPPPQVPMRLAIAAEIPDAAFVTLAAVAQRLAFRSRAPPIV